MTTPPPPGASTILAAIVVLVLSAGAAAYLLRREPRTWPVIAALATLSFGFALAYNQFLPDDSYITYRYAWNLLHGNGLVYNPGEYVLSTTTPLYTLLLAAAGLVWPDLPVTSHILSLPALFAGALVLYLLLARHGKPVAGFLLAALYILNPLTAAVYSSESILHVALIFGTFYAYDQDYLEWAAALSALAVLTRGDGALVVIALGLCWLAARRRREGWRRPLRAVAIYAAISLPWYLFSWIYYGDLAPATMSAKIAQGELPGAQLFMEGFGVWWMSYSAHSPGYWLLLPLALLGLLLTFPRGGDRWAWPTLLWAGLYTAGYTALGVTRYQNYYTPLAPVLILLAMLGAHWLGLAVAHFVTQRAPVASPGAAAWRQARIAGVVMLLLGIGIGIGFVTTGARLYPTLPQARAVIYQQIGEWLRANTPPDASVGMLEVGTMGYYADRRVIDFYGLIQPDVSEHMAHNDLAWSMQHYKPDYIAIHRETWAPTYDPWFDANYQPLKTFEYARCGCSPMVVYARK
jgi:arabinofuranosyltransferase